MKKLGFLLTFLPFTSLVIAQTGNEPMGGAVEMQETQVFVEGTADQCNYLSFDESFFTNNWYSDQTYAYLSTPTVLEGNEIIQLLQDDEQFVLPRFGTMWSGFKKGHKGLDIHLDKGDSVRAAFNGIVRYATYNKGGFGNLVIIRHFNGLETYYAHLSDMFVSSGDTIPAGYVLGLGGSTGRSKGPHLHFEVRFKDMPLDPLSFIDFYSRRLKTPELMLSQDVFSPWDYGIDRTKEGDPVASRGIVSEDTRPEDFHAEVKYASTLSSNGGVSSVSSTSGTSSTSSSGTAKYYTIKSGDTLWKISQTYGTTVSKLCSLNGIKETSILQIGQKIRYK